MRREGDELGVEPVAAIGLRDLVGQARPERLGVVGERGRRPQRLDVDAGLQVGRAEVRVDEPGDVLVEAEAEQEVVAGDRIRNGDLPLPADRERRRGVGRHEPRSPGSEPIPWPGAIPFSSPTNGIPCRSTASRLIRSAAVFASATSRT